MSQDKSPITKPGWIEFAVAEIERSGRRFSKWELDFLKSVKERLAMNFQLTDPMTKSLSELHRKSTDIRPIPRRGSSWR